MAGNIFDQFDSTAQPTPAAAPKNIFDQFDDQGSVDDVALRSRGADPEKGVLASTWEKIKGRQDPQYADVSSFDRTPDSLAPGVQGKVFGGMLAGANGAAYGDIIQKSLGDRFIRRYKDANGYDLIDYKGEDGRPKTAYVEKPGLDASDIVRGGVGAIPYVVGGVGGAGLKIGNLILRGLLQGGVQGSTNVLGQVAQHALGSEQDFDKTQAAAATLLGGAGEVIPSKVMAPIVGGLAGFASTYDPDKGADKNTAAGTALGTAAGYAAQALARRMLKMNPSAWINKDGSLTERAQAAATAAGIDVKDLKGAVAQDWAKAMAATRNPAEAAVAAESRNGIPMTAGQRAKDYQQLVLEDQMRAGQKGMPAQQEINRFDVMQRRAVEDSAFGGQYAEPHGPSPVVPTPGVAPAPPPSPILVKPGVTATINPTNGAAKPSPDWLNQFGESTQSGLQAAREGAKQATKKAWEGADNILPNPAAMDMLPDQISMSIKANGISPPLDDKSASQQMLALLRDYHAGKIPVSPDKFVPDMSGQNVNEVRKQLGTMTRSAKDDQDRAVAGAIYKGYNDWLDAAANAGHFPADVVASIRGGRAMSKEVKDLFEPLYKGKKTPAAAMIEKAMQSDSAEGTINSLLGQGPTNSISFGRILALSNVKDALSKFADPKIGQQTWNDLRTAYVNRMLLDKNGQMQSYDMIANNIERSFANQKSVWNVLLGPDEQRLLVQLGRDTRRISTKEIAPKFRTNASGSAFAGGAMIKDLFENIMQTIGTSKTAQAAIGIAKGLPGAKNLAQKTADQYNLAAARQAVSQTPKEIVPSFGPYSGAVFGASKNAFDDRN